MKFQGVGLRSFDLRRGCGTIGFVRWLIAIVVSIGIASPATAGVFKARGQKPAAAPAKKPAVEKTAGEKPATKKAPAKAAPAKKSAAKAPAKKPRGAVASSGRPDDLTPDEAPPPKKSGKKSKDAEVSIVEDVEEDVIIRDIDD